MTAIPEQEVLRYLRAPDEPDANLRAQIREVCALFEARVTPRHICRVYPLTVSDTALSFAGESFAPGSFYDHLRHCSAVMLFGATLGVEADRLTHAESVRSMLRGSIAHAAGAAMIEQYCDDTQAALAASYQNGGQFLSARFSPGYGDLPLSFQQTFFQLLPLEKQLGLRLNEHCMMTPSKSITAIIGISSQQGVDFRRCTGQCRQCMNYACSFRKEG